MIGYQHKLNFGESEETHKRYEEYLEWSGLEDTPERWAIFSEVNTAVETYQAMIDKEQGTVQ